MRADKAPLVPPPGWHGTWYTAGALPSSMGGRPRREGSAGLGPWGVCPQSVHSGQLMAGRKHCHG